jgi:hypothetical protein
MMGGEVTVIKNIAGAPETNLNVHPMESLMARASVMHQIVEATSNLSTGEVVMVVTAMHARRGRQSDSAERRGSYLFF